MQRDLTDGQPSDEHLISMLVTGDSNAIDMLWDRHARPVYSLAVRMLGDSGWAEEIVQDVFYRLWSNPGMYDSSRGDLRRWLLAVTHHAAVDGLRGRRGTARAHDNGPHSLEMLPYSGETPGTSVWRKLRAENVRAAMLNLPSAQREVIELAYFQGLTQMEIAQRTGQPLGTVKTRLRLGQQKLRALLDRIDIR